PCWGTPRRPDIQRPAISLLFGICVSTALTLVVIPIVYYVAYRHRLTALTGAVDPDAPDATTSLPTKSSIQGA
ncbi:MAG: hypothetical protein M3R60_09280, partial [Pseudomonadota bacterium]|nr:hypothetical protein [Pseudomonadota bacterium]